MPLRQDGLVWTELSSVILGFNNYLNHQQIFSDADNLFILFYHIFICWQL